MGPATGLSRGTGRLSVLVGLGFVGRRIGMPRGPHPRQRSIGRLVGDDILAPLHELFPLRASAVDGLAAAIHVLGYLLLACRQTATCCLPLSTMALTSSAA